MGKKKKTKAQIFAEVKDKFGISAKDENDWGAVGKIVSTLTGLGFFVGLDIEAERCAVLIERGTPTHYDHILVEAKAETALVAVSLVALDVV